MSLSIQTNVASLIAQNNIVVNTNFQNNTITQLSSGYRINSSADDAAGLAVANQYRGDTAELTQGVLNANNGVAQLQIADGGLNNIATILDRLRTLATESASTTFVGDRGTLNNEYQGLLTEVNRQAANIGLNTGGTSSANQVTYVGGGNNQANAQVSVNLSGAAVDSAGLGIGGTSVQGAGTELTGNSTLLNTGGVFLAAGATQAFTFQTSGGTTTTANLTGTTAGLTANQVISSLNSQLQTLGITAAVGTDGLLQFSSANAFSVSAAAASVAANGIAGASSANNAANYNLSTSTLATFPPGANGDTITFTQPGGAGTALATVTLNAANAGATITTAITAINAQLTGSGITAVVDQTNPGAISFQSATAFQASDAISTGATATNLFAAAGVQAVTAPSASASPTANALSALTSITSAVSNLGTVQGIVGAGINKLNYAVSLAQSQITNFSVAQSNIRDADIAAEAANLTKAQVLQQASLAALAQANSAPQNLLSLLKS
ncbi:MAG: flagellin [Bryobacteraceae bacterium]|jgi:flagellin